MWNKFAAIAAGAAIGTVGPLLLFSERQPEKIETPTSTPENDCCTIENSTLMSCDGCNANIFESFYFAKKDPSVPPLPKASKEKLFEGETESAYYHFCVECWTKNFNRFRFNIENSAIRDHVKRLEALSATAAGIDSLGRDPFEVAVQQEKEKQMLIMKEAKKRFAVYARKNSPYRVYKSYRSITTTDKLLEFLKKEVEWYEMVKQAGEVEINLELLNHIMLSIPNIASLAPEDLPEDAKDTVDQGTHALFEFAWQLLSERMIQKKANLKNVDEWKEFYEPVTGLSFKHPDGFIPLVHGESNICVEFSIASFAPETSTDSQRRDFACMMLPRFNVKAPMPQHYERSMETMINAAMEEATESLIQDLTILTQDIFTTEDGTKIHFYELVGTKPGKFGQVSHVFLGIAYANGFFFHFCYECAANTPTFLTLDFIVKLLKSVRFRPTNSKHRRLGYYHPAGFSFEFPNHAISHRFEFMRPKNPMLLVIAESSNAIGKKDTVTLQVSIAKSYVPAGKIVTTVVTRSQQRVHVYMKTGTTAEAIIPASPSRFLISFTKERGSSYDVAQFTAEVAASFQTFTPNFMTYQLAPEASSVFTSELESVQMMVPTKNYIQMLQHSDSCTDTVMFANMLYKPSKPSKAPQRYVSISSTIHTTVVNKGETIESVSERFLCFMNDDDSKMESTTLIPVSNGSYITGRKVLVTRQASSAIVLAYHSPADKNKCIVFTALANDNSIPELEQVIKGITVLAPCKEVRPFQTTLFASQTSKMHADISVELAEK